MLFCNGLKLFMSTFWLNLYFFAHQNLSKFSVTIVYLFLVQSQWMPSEVIVYTQSASCLMVCNYG